jgi:hypothetical protein
MWSPKSFGQIEVASSRDPSELSQSIESVTGSKCNFFSNTIEYLPWLDPTLPASHPCCWCSNMETRLEFLCSTSASWIMKDHLAITTTIVAMKHYWRCRKALWEMILWVAYSDRNSWSRDFRVSYRCADPQKSFGQIEGSIESRSVRFVAINRVLREAVPSISTLSSTTMVDPTLPG